MPETPITLIIEDLPAPKPEQVAKKITFQGQLDESNIDENSKTIYNLIKQYPKNLFLLFEFSKLEYMNSKAIGYLTDWCEQVSQGHGNIVIANPMQNIREILETVGITDMVKLYTSIDEAKSALFLNH
jgi:anti-anti-sigma factor